jgi:putative transposon-encoded protein
MPRKVNLVATNELSLKGITGFIKRKVTCPKEYLGKTAYLVLTDEEWVDDG